MKVAFVGSKVLGASVLNTMYDLVPDNLCAIVTIDDSQDARCALSVYEQFSKSTNVPLRVLSKSSELPSVIFEISPDLCVVVGWYWILNPSLLEMVPGGWLGIHASLLPKYRGGSPLVWAIINGDTESGISLFYFDEGMDTGDIVAQKSFEIGFEETIADVLHKVEFLSVEVINEKYLPLIHGTAARTLQDNSQATFAALRKPVHGRIDWTWDNVRIHNFIRAQTHPYPGAFCFTSSGKLLRVWKASVFTYPFYGTPGQVVAVKKDHVIVTCGGDSAICLDTMQIDGRDEHNAVEVTKFGEQLS